MKPKRISGEKTALLHAEPPHNAKIHCLNGPGRSGTDCPDAYRREKNRPARHAAEKTGSTFYQAAADPRRRRKARRRKAECPRSIRASTLRARSGPNRPRDPKISIVNRIFGKFRCGGGLQPKIHLDLDRTRQSIDNADRIEPLRFGRNPFHHASGKKHVAEIAPETAFDARSQDLDRHRTFDAPSTIWPRCTCATEAAATGSLNSEKTLANGRPKALSMTLTARRAQTAPCDPASDSNCRATATPTTSGRVARVWPSLT